MPSRPPSLLWILLPCAVLALVGGRAVVAEIESVELDTRRDAEAAAARLGRSLTTLVREHRDALREPGTVVSDDELDRVGAHLEPVWRIGSPAREHAEERSPLAADALARATELAADGQEDTAADLAATAATLVDEQRTRAELLATAVRHESDERLRGQTAARWLEALLAADAPAEDIATALDAALSPLGRPKDDVLAAAYRALATAGDTELRRGIDGTLDTVEGVVGADLSLVDRVGRQVADRVLGPPRVVGRGPWALDTVAGPLVLVGTSVRTSTGGATLVVGAVPQERLTDRLTQEAGLLVADGQVAAVRLTDPTGVDLVRSGPASALDEETVRMALDAPLAEWTVLVAPRPADELPPLALFLGVATLLTTATLAFGAVALRRTTVEQTRLAEDRRRFLDHVAHEIRTPAASLLALSEELAAGHVAGDRRPTYDALLLGEARRLTDLVEETLDLSRLEAGRLRFEREPCDVVELVRRALDDVGTGAAPGVQATLPDDAVEILADPRAIVRTVRNLVENALMHSGASEPVQVTVTTDAETVRVEVTDRGRGIAPEHVERLFEPFFRVEDETHERKGVGLGLVLCNEVARAHDGRLTVVSELGRGSRFTLELPRRTT